MERFTKSVSIRMAAGREAASSASVKAGDYAGKRPRRVSKHGQTAPGFPRSRHRVAFRKDATRRSPADTRTGRRSRKMPANLLEQVLEEAGRPLLRRTRWSRRFPR